MAASPFHSLQEIPPPTLPPDGLVAWDATMQNGDLVLALAQQETSTSQSRLQIVRWNATTPEWQEISVGGLPDATTPFLRFSESEPLVLATQADGEACFLLDGEELHRGNPADTGILPHSLLISDQVEVGGRRFGLHEGYGSRLVRARADGTWEALDNPSTNGMISHIAVLQGNLVVAVDDGTRGFEIFSASQPGEEKLEWKCLLSRGASRFSANAEVLSLLSHRDELWIACGRREPKPTWFEQGFEVISLRLDGSWEVVIGSLRVTPNGLKVPLSGYAPGLDEFDPSTLCFFATSGTGLLLGVFGRENGLSFWASTDGFVWERTVSGESLGCRGVRKTRVLQKESGVVVLLEIDHLVRGRTLSIWQSGAESL